MKNDWQEDLTLTSHSKRKGYGQISEMRGSFDTRVRMRVIWGIFVTLLSVIVARIFYLQVVTRGQHQLTSYDNHIELHPVVAERGKIYDRHGNEIPRDRANSQVVGYTAQVLDKEIGCTGGLCYQAGGRIGRAGLEAVMEASLRGRDGGRLVEVDAQGRDVRELGSNQAESGDDLHLSIDAQLQQIAYSALGGKRGSAVMIDMQGRVLALVSSPAYDPLEVPKYLQDTSELFFLNRPLSATYPPGSVFKLVTAMAGLEEGDINSDTQFEDTGEIKVGTYRYGNWYFDQYGQREGVLGLTRALARSNDIYFYKVGEAVGVDRLVKWSAKFGFGEKTGIELPGEVSGLVPDQLYKERRTGEKWFLGNTYHMAIGQGDLLVTPAQVARMTLSVISGRRCELSLLRDKAVECSDLGLKTENIDLVREGMRQACATGGTAFPFFAFDPWVMCKTGTAQHGGQKNEEDLPHAWITVAYPGENPEFILTVMLESAGEGSAEAGPVAKTILEGWRGLGR